jgi:hypothetical protein
LALAHLNLQPRTVSLALPVLAVGSLGHDALKAQFDRFLEHRFTVALNVFADKTFGSFRTIFSRAALRALSGALRRSLPSKASRSKT